MTPQVVRVLGLQIREIWKRVGVNQKVSILLALLACAAAIGGMLYWGTRPDYRLLYSGMTMQDAAAMREKLDDERIPARLKDSGRSIYVPAGEVYRARLLLASQGLPKDPSAGFELFEQPNFGLTDFAQRVNYQRALQGELERTVSSMINIEAARITLVLPKEKLFSSKQEKNASASIMLTVAGGSTVPAAQVRSITHLVASAVPGLAATSITVADQEGRLLSAPSETPEDQTTPTNEQLALQRKIETELAGKAQEMLDKALGPDRSIVRVSADVDFSRVEQSKETYEGDGRVARVENVESETSSRPTSSPAGVPGTHPNVRVPVATGTAEWENSLSRSKRENIRTEYLVPSGVQRILQTGARIRRLSVSVCVAKDAQRAAGEIEKIDKIVKSAVGYVDDPAGGRVDMLTVQEMDFVPTQGPRTMPWWFSLPVSLNGIGRGVLVALLLLAVYIVSRRMVAGTGAVQGTDVGVPIGALAGQGMGHVRVGDHEGAKGMVPGRDEHTIDMNVAEVLGSLKENPRAAAAWIKHVVGTE